MRVLSKSRHISALFPPAAFGLWILGLLHLGLTGCGTAPNRRIERAPLAATSPGDSKDSAPSGPAGVSTTGSRPSREQEAAIAIVGGQPVTVGELLGAWLHRDSREVRRTIDELILSHLVMLEAVRLGVELPGAALDEALTEATDRLREEVHKVGEGWTVDEFLARRLGLDPKRYLAVLREQTAIDLYAERVVRAWLLESDRRELRVILTESEEKARQARAALDDGEPFETVRERFSIDDGGGSDGRVPPVVAGETAMAYLAFQTPVGEIGGPLEESGRWLLVQVTGKPEVLSGDWDAIGPAVEASLAQRAIEDPEYWQWKNWVMGRYEVDMSPLIELSGGALVE